MQFLLMLTNILNKILQQLQVGLLSEMMINYVGTAGAKSLSNYHRAYLLDKRS